jgi:hypothetical protein
VRSLSCRRPARLLLSPCPELNLVAFSLNDSSHRDIELLFMPSVKALTINELFVIRAKLFVDQIVLTSMLAYKIMTASGARSSSSETA